MTYFRTSALRTVSLPIGGDKTRIVNADDCGRSVAIGDAALYQIQLFPRIMYTVLLTSTF